MADHPQHQENEQTLNEFYRKISERTQLNSNLLIPVTRSILGSLVRRLHYTGAARLTFLLPKNLQEDLLDMPAGPDRSITVEKLIQGLVRDFRMTEPTARATLFNFYASLEEMLPPKEVVQIKSQLPEDFQALFAGASEAPRETGNVA